MSTNGQIFKINKIYMKQILYIKFNIPFYERYNTFSESCPRVLIMKRTGPNLLRNCVLKDTLFFKIELSFALKRGLYFTGASNKSGEMYFIAACTLAYFYYRGNLHFNLELEPVLNRITVRDTLTCFFLDPFKACKYRKG